MHVDVSLCSRCVICMMDFEYSDPIRFLPCLHIYHVDCIDPWLMRSFTCPSCMEPVDAALLSSYETNWAAPSWPLPPKSNAYVFNQINPRGLHRQAKWSGLTEVFGRCLKMLPDGDSWWKVGFFGLFRNSFAFSSRMMCQINLDECCKCSKISLEIISTVLTPYCFSLYGNWIPRCQCSLLPFFRCTSCKKMKSKKQ